MTRLSVTLEGRPETQLVGSIDTDVVTEDGEMSPADQTIIKLLSQPINFIKCPHNKICQIGVSSGRLISCPILTKLEIGQEDKIREARLKCEHLNRVRRGCPFIQENKLLDQCD